MFIHDCLQLLRYAEFDPSHRHVIYELRGPHLGVHRISDD